MEIYRDSNVVIYMSLQEDDYTITIHRIASGVEQIPLGYIVGRNSIIFPINSNTGKGKFAPSKDFSNFIKKINNGKHGEK